MTSAPAAPKKRLEDVNTRLFFINELLETWRIGQQIIQETSAKFSTPKDKTRLAEITAAVKLLEAERDLVAGYDKEQFRLKLVIDSIPRLPKEEVQEPQKGVGNETPKDDTSAGAQAD